jgi:hypothetical protein
MGIIITWSMIFWVLAAVIAICGLAWLLLRVAYLIARDENAPDVSIQPKTPASNERTTEFREATVEAFRKKVPEFGRRRSLSPDLTPSRSFFHHYRLADVAERWKHHGTAALKTMALPHKGRGLRHRFRKGSKASHRIASRSGRFIFVKSSEFFQRLAESWKHHGTAPLNKMDHGLRHRFRKGSKASHRIASRSGRFIFVKSGGFLRQLGRGLQKVRPLFLRQLGRG